MIRKKRITTQVDLFVQEEVLTPDPNNTPSSDVPFSFEKITVTRGFENPILMRSMDEIETLQNDTTGNQVKELLIPLPANETTEREEIVLPETPHEEEPEPKQVLKNDRENLIINRDFSDGFYLNEAQKKTYEDKIMQEELTLQRNIRHKFVLKIITVVMLSFAALLLWNWQDWVINSSLFTLKNVFVQGSLMSNKDEILKAADLDMGVRLAEVNVAKTAERIKMNPIFKTVTVSRNYPSSIVIHVTERQPFAFVLLDELYAVDNNGFVLPKLKAKMIYNLPIISGINAVATPGKRLSSPKLLLALQFLDKAKQLDEAVYYEISEINIRKDDMDVYLNSIHATVKIDEANPDRSVIYLGTALPYFKQNENTDRMKVIDLRYEGQILVKN
jgi:cell division septal protein FtsQ